MVRTSMSRSSVMVVGVLAALASQARPAHACGGFFCNRPPPDGTLPIAQAGENVLFVLERGTNGEPGKVEAHIQIIYKGTADQFSWVVPVTAVPTLDVGTDVLFDRLEPATRPSYRVQFVQDGTCQGQGNAGGGSGCVGAAGSFSPRASNDSNGGAVNDGRPAVEVVFRGNVGPYDSAVIRSDDPMALKTWLTTNGYYVSDDSAAIVDQYVAAHSYFVALRLRRGEDTSAIRPIVLRMAGDEGCLPLKLTAIASTPDLRANVWVLGDARAVPLDYVEIGINQAKLDWFNFGKNYDKLLGEAANEAGGNAFAVEYAKPSDAVATQLLVPQTQIAQLATTSTPGAFVSLLQGMGFQPTGQVLVVLRKYLPEPATLVNQGVTEAQFYGNPFSIQGTQAFDAAPIVAELQATVFTPLAAVQPLFASHPYLTRLATFISPDEMTKDPRFVTNADLPNFDNQHMAVANMQCGDQDYDICHAPVRLHLDDGTDIHFAAMAGASGSCNGQQQPSNYARPMLDAMPSADVGWLRDASGEGHMVIDQRKTISGALIRQNASVSLSTGGCGCSVRGRGRPMLLASLVIAALILARRRRSAR